MSSLPGWVEIICLAYVTVRSFPLKALREQGVRTRHMRSQTGSEDRKVIDEILARRDQAGARLAPPAPEAAVHDGHCALLLSKAGPHATPDNTSRHHPGSATVVRSCRARGCRGRHFGGRGSPRFTRRSLIPRTTR